MLNGSQHCLGEFGHRVLAAARERRIAEAAYLRARERGFAPGHDKEDWEAAEREVDLCDAISTLP